MSELTPQEHKHLSQLATNGKLEPDKKTMGDTMTFNMKTGKFVEA